MQRQHLPGLSEMEDALEDAHGTRLVQRSDIGLGFVEPLNPIRQHLLAEGNVFRLEPELSKDFFHRNALAVALGEPGLAVADPASVFLGHRLVICRLVGDRAGHRIEHRFEQTANRRNLPRGKPVYEFVNLLLLVSAVRWHGGIDPCVNSTAVNRNEGMHSEVTPRLGDQ